MNKFRFEMNKEGVGELLKSEEMQAVLESYAAQVAKDAGPGYEPKTYIGKDRAAVSVRVEAATKEAERDNYENNTLLRSI